MAKPILRILSPVIGAEEQLMVLGRSAITLGRGEDNDVVLLEQAASRDHARIEPCEGGYEIVDCSSAAGLWLKGARIKRHKLEDGDEVKVGGTTLRYVESAHSEPTVVPTATGSGPTAPPAWDLVPNPEPSVDPDDAMAATLLPQEGHEFEAQSLAPEAGPAEATPAEATPAEATPAEAAPTGTLAAAHIEAPAPSPPEPAAEQPVAPPEAAPSKNETSGYSLGLDGSSPSVSGYSLDGSGPAQRDGLSLGGPSPSTASVYSLGGSGPAQREGLSLGAPAASDQASNQASNNVGGLELDLSAAKAPAVGGASRDSGYSLEGRSDAPFASIDIHDDGLGLQGGQRRTSAGTVFLFVVIGAAAAFGVLTALQGPPW